MEPLALRSDLRVLTSEWLECMIGSLNSVAAAEASTIAEPVERPAATYPVQVPLETLPE